MPVTAKFVLAFRGVFRAECRRGIKLLNSMRAYHFKHPDKNVFTAPDLVEIESLIETFDALLTRQVLKP